MGTLTIRGVQTGDLVKDWRRMNVAFTRARAKLIIFGSRKTLARTPLLESFFELMEGEDWIIQLPHGVHEAHAEVFHPTQDPLTTGRRKHEDCMDNMEPEKKGKEECSIGAGGSKRRRIGPDVGVLRGRPILRDIFNDVIDLT
jgi:DNA replication ATP-dependent helicase Dna2